LICAARFGRHADGGRCAPSVLLTAKTWAARRKIKVNYPTQANGGLVWATREAYTNMRDLKWSATEKAIARRAFDSALQRELDAVIQEAKERAARVSQPADLWELEHWLTQRRKEIDRTYDYRYSVLPLVFRNLIRDGRLSEQELQGLAEDKLAYIRQART